MRWFKEVKLTMKLHLPPVFLGNITAGVDTVLNSYLMKYIDELDGVVLAYWDWKITSPVAQILHDLPELHFLINVSMLLFTPSVGTILDGTVNKLGLDHIGLLVFGNFNASIKKDKIPPEYVRNLEQECWVHKDDPTRKIGLHDEVRFRVEKLAIGGDVLTIHGSMLDEETGPAAYLRGQKKKRGKKAKKDKREQRTASALLSTTTAVSLTLPLTPSAAVILPPSRPVVATSIAPQTTLPTTPATAVQRATSEQADSEKKKKKKKKSKKRQHSELTPSAHDQPSGAVQRDPAEPPAKRTKLPA